MVETLQSEGYNVNSRQVTKLRGLDGLKLRHNNTSKPSEPQPQNDNDVISPARQVPVELQIARQSKQAALWTESAERLKNRTRRRRTKGWNGLPPDQGLPPRFPSELTLEENRQILNLDRPLYLQIRSTFKQVCSEFGVERKVACAPGVWESAKNELINRIPHLQAIFNSPEAGSYDRNREPMALDLICMDVTKSMRVATKSITLTDAKNILNLSPTESREIRLLFESVLRSNYFVNRRDVTKEEWESFKEQWKQQSPLLQREFSTMMDPDLHKRKEKALEIIARDVHKRHRDYMVPRDTNIANKRKAAERAKDGTPKKQRVAKAPKERVPPTHEPDWRSPSGRPPWMPSTPPPETAQTSSSAIPYEQTHRLQELAAAAQIDPDLLAAAATEEDPMVLQTPSHPAPPATMTTAPQTFTVPDPIFIRLTPATVSRYPHLPKVLLGQLAPPYTIQALHAVLGKKLAGLQHGCKIDGLADGAAVDNEAGIRWSIEQDDELEAYVEYVKEGGGKLAFLVDVA